MSKNKGSQKSITAIIVKALFNLIFKTIKNIKLYNIKTICNSNILRITYIIITLISIYCILHFKTYKGLVIAPFSFFMLQAIKQIIVEWYYTVRYYKVYLLFDKKAKIVEVRGWGCIYRKKVENFAKFFGGNSPSCLVKRVYDNYINNGLQDITFIIHSFIPIADIQKKIGTLEQYLNTNVLEVKQDKFNKRLIVITTSKLKDMASITTLDGKLTHILRDYGFNPELMYINNGDFETSVAYKIDTDIKSINSKVDDISFKLDHAITVELRDSKYIFNIKEKECKIYNFQDYLYTVKPKKNMILPAVIGLRHKDSKLLIVDMSKLLHTFINGKTGSGKSCMFNSFIQSMMIYSSNKCVFIMVDFKIVEFKQYESFKNVVYLNKMEYFYSVLIDIQKEIDSRYKKFGKIKNIDDYNYAGHNMPYIIICIDECSCISLDKNYKNKIWDILIDIVQRGRACGILIVAATQCPDHTLVDTSFRRQIDTKVIGRLSRIEDAKIAGINEKVGVEKFCIGEFVIDCIGYDHIKLQGLYIDEKANKNIVFECLESKLSLLGTNLLDKNGRNEGLKCNDFFDYGTIIKQPANPVIDYVARFKKLLPENEFSNENNNIMTNGTNNETPLYIRLLFYLADNSYTTMPSVTDRLESLGTTEKKLRKAQEKLYEIGILCKKTEKDRNYYINVDKLNEMAKQIRKETMAG